MNYYRLVFGFHQLLLLIHSYKCLQSHTQLPDSYNNNNENNNRSSTNRYCERIMTYTEVVELLLRSSCQLIDAPSETDKNNRKKRDVAGDTTNVHALVSTINDHRTMIEYLINNTMNTTYVTQAITNHHSRTGPILSSWRDLVDLLFLGLVVIILLYVLLCRVGFATVDNALSFLFRPVATRIVQQQQYRPETPPLSTITARIVAPNRARPRSPTN